MKTRFTRRSFVSGLAASAFAPFGVSGCGGGGDGAGEPDSGRSTPSSSGTSTTPITTLFAHSTAAGTYPYSATVLALPGQVPSTAKLISDEDSSLSHAVLSTWPDGSASVVVVSGRLTVATAEIKQIKLSATSSTATNIEPLSATAITSAISSIEIDFGANGSARLTNLGPPEHIWWQTANMICGRYRLAVPGHPTLEAVIDVHAYSSGRTFVEVVIENGKLNVSQTSLSAPAPAIYDAATVSVNGQPIASAVSSAAAAEGSHSAFRAWYCSGWLGGATGLRVFQNHVDLQKHPLLFKMARENRSDLSGYSGDTYAPWSIGRHRAANMGAGGDHESIGPLTRWDAQFLQTGDARLANAVEVSALAVLSFNINYRNSVTGLVPTFEEIGLRDQQGNPPKWPRMLNSGARVTWEVAHHPSVGLMAFVARPSPVYIELAQKVTAWNGTWSPTRGWQTGTFGFWYQMRGRAWCVRTLLHATFLTPSKFAWRASGVTALASNVDYLSRWQSEPKALLNTMWDYEWGSGYFDADNNPGFQVKMWQFHFIITELHKVASSRVLSGDAQAKVQSLADWCAMQPVRWINEQADGGWRYVPYHTTLGRSSGLIDSLPTWGEQVRWTRGEAAPAVAGPWMFPADTATPFAQSSVNQQAGSFYPSYLWAALVTAVERGVPGAEQAWTTVNRDLTTLSDWIRGFEGDPRWGATPRLQA